MVRGSGFSDLINQAIREGDEARKAELETVSTMPVSKKLETLSPYLYRLGREDLNILFAPELRAEEITGPVRQGPLSSPWAIFFCGFIAASVLFVFLCALRSS